VEEASATGGITTKKNKTPTTGSSSKGGKTSQHRSESNVIQELAGYLFTFGNQGQQSNYLKTKRAIGDYFAMTSDFGKEIHKAIKDGKEPEFQEPDEPQGKPS
jgi:hypothetical protein